MSASILKSLQKLNSAVVNLEHAVETKKKVLTSAPVRKNGPQSDLFSAVTAAQGDPANLSVDNVRTLATRLDKAINQVETILKEGRG